MPAVYAHWSPWRNESRAAAVMASAYCGCWAPIASAPSEDLVSCTCLDDGHLLGGSLDRGGRGLGIAGVSRAPQIDCMIAPPRSRCTSAVP